MLKKIKNELYGIVKGKVYFEEPMRKHTTFKIGGKAEVFIVPLAEDDLIHIIKFLDVNRIKYIFLGQGSNVLVRDKGIRNIAVLTLTKSDYFRRTKVFGENILAFAGASLKEVLKAAKECCLGGIEFLEGIPGSIGGAVNMNAGAHGFCLGDYIKEIRTLDYRGTIRIYDRNSLKFQYRKGLQSKVIISVLLKLHKSGKKEIERKCRQFRECRKQRQPAGSSAGSIFKNPAGRTAGSIIEELKLKGVSQGDAYVSYKHANFIINSQNAKAKDVLFLINKIKKTAKIKRHISLLPEIKIIGDK